MSEITKELSDIGLTEYEAKVYGAMLRQDLLTASDITRIGSVPRGRVYDIINQLIEKGFCETVRGAVKKFRAVAPESAIKNLVEQRRKQEQKILEAGAKLQERYNLKKVNASPMDYIQVLTSRQSQIKKFLELEKSAKKFCYSFNKKPYVSDEYGTDYRKVFGSHEKAIIKSGIKAKAIYEADNDNTEQFIRLAGYFETLGEELRICEELPMKMLISDGSTVMISLRNAGAARFNLSSMVVEHTDLTKALIKLFEFYWNSSLTLAEFTKLKNLKKIPHK